MSFQVEVIADNSGQWEANALRFETQVEADLYGRDLMWRWLAVKEMRIVSCDDRVTAKWEDGRLIHLSMPCQ